MPQKVCEGDNLHVIFRIRWEKWGISGKTNRKKWGISGKKARDRFENEKRTENEYVRLWGISGKIAYAIT